MILYLLSKKETVVIKELVKLVKYIGNTVKQKEFESLNHYKVINIYKYIIYTVNEVNENGAEYVNLG